MLDDISEEIINFVKIKLVSGQYKVDITRELKVSVWTVQSVTNVQRTLERSTQARVCRYVCETCHKEDF